MVQREVGERFAAAPGTRGLRGAVGARPARVRGQGPAAGLAHGVPAGAERRLGARSGCAGGVRAGGPTRRCVRSSTARSRTAARRSPGRWRWRPGAPPGVRERARAALIEHRPPGRRARRAAGAGGVPRAGGEAGGPVKLFARAPGKVNLCLFLGPTARRRPPRARDAVRVGVARGRARAGRLARRSTTRSSARASRVRTSSPRALAALRAAGWDAPPVRVKIDKRIPVAAGMGGGSADAAAALRLAARLAPVAAAALARDRRRLGADVPSQLAPGLVARHRRGSSVEPLAPLAPHAFVIVPLPHRAVDPRRLRARPTGSGCRDDGRAAARLPDLWSRAQRPVSACPTADRQRPAAGGAVAVPADRRRARRARATAGADQAIVSRLGSDRHRDLLGGPTWARARGGRRGALARTLARAARSGAARFRPLSSDGGAAAVDVGHRVGTIPSDSMSNTTITYLVGAGRGVFGLIAFCTLVVAPAVTAYRRVR